MRTPEQIAARVAAVLEDADNVDIEVDINRAGDLVLFWATVSARDWLVTRQNDPVDAHHILSDILEDFWRNGGYEPFDATRGNPNVGLTDAPCIAEQLVTHDDGTCEIVGRYWYYADYMIKNPIDELIKHGAVTFTLAT